jgi:aldose sugar dehydrogenase
MMANGGGTICAEPGDPRILPPTGKIQTRELMLKPLSFCALVALGSIAGGTTAGAEQTNAPSAAKTALTVTEIATGLQNPWGLQFLSGGRYLVTERPGRLRIISPDGALSAPVTGVLPVMNSGQGGLLDVLLSPDFETSGTLFLSFAEPRGLFKNGTSVARARLVIDGTNARLEDVKIIFRQEPAIASGYHFGSRLVFDKSGALFVTTGERATEKDSAQDLATDLGKVIRILPDGAIPKDNPFVGQDGKQPEARPEIWSYGHRNLQGAALDPASGQLWTTEHAAKGGDELNHPEAGKNYGWPIIAWGTDYDGSPIGEGLTAKPGLEQPVYYWNPSIGTSGLAFYTGSLFKGWTGNILAGGLAGGVLERLVLDGGKVVAVEHLLTERRERIRDVRAGPDGAVYVLTDSPQGKLLRLTPGT